MRRFPGLRRLMRIDRGARDVDRAVNDELQFHFDMAVRDLMNSGLTPDEARREAERRFGDVQRTRERLATIDRARAGKQRRAEWWSAFAQDVRYALRGLRLKPGFAAAVIVTLGLGIGANATMFGIVDRLLFRPPNLLIAPDRAGRIYIPQAYRGKESLNSFLSYRRFLDLKRGTTSFDAMSPYYSRRMAIGVGNATRQMDVSVFDADLWKMFDARPVLGRFFTDAESTPEDPQLVVVLSYAYWQTQYGGRNDVLGESIDIGVGKYTVIGVAPEGFTALSPNAPMGFISTAAHSHDRASTRGRPWYDTYNSQWFEAVARRKATVSQAAADADLTRAHVDSYRRQLDEQPSLTPTEQARPRGFLAPLLDARGPTPSKESKVATWLGAVSIIVLLIACANVINLLLARAMRRRREIAVRLALGVSHGRLIMQLLIESTVLAVAGAASGLMIAYWGGAVIRRALLDEQAARQSLGDIRQIAFIGLVAGFVGLLTGLAPVFQARRTDISGTLKAGVREGVVYRSRLRSGLLIMQAALSVLLLVGAGLFVRSLRNVNDVRLGYDADRLLIVATDWRGMQLDTIQKQALLERIRERALTLPNVENATRSLTMPFYSNWTIDLHVPGIDTVAKLGTPSLQVGSPSLLATFGTRLIRGRDITADDRAESPRVAVINESMGKLLWPGQDPIGKTFRVNGDTTPPITIVGVAEDLRRQNLTDPNPFYYLPITQFRFSDDFIAVRTRGPAADAAEAVRRGLQPLMPGVSFVTTVPVSKLFAGNTRSWRLGATMFTVFGLLALVLAAIGLYSVIAYNVTQRMHEMGVRVALGAQARDVIRLIVREGLAVVLPGAALGAIAALAASRWMQPLLFQVSPRDPAVVTTVLATLIVVAVVASWVPATRAARVDPSEALRAD